MNFNLLWKSSWGRLKLSKAFGFGLFLPTNKHAKMQKLPSILLRQIFNRNVFRLQNFLFFFLDYEKILHPEVLQWQSCAKPPWKPVNCTIIHRHVYLKCCVRVSVFLFGFGISYKCCGKGSDIFTFLRCLDLSLTKRTNLQNRKIFLKNLSK